MTFTVANLTAKINKTDTIGKKYTKPTRKISSVQFSHSVVSDSVTPWTIAHQAPLFVEFSRQEYWSGLPFPSPTHESKK